jgi:hypothetical protein
VDAVALLVGGDIGRQVRLELKDGDPGAAPEIAQQVEQVHPVVPGEDIRGVRS